METTQKKEIQLDYSIKSPQERSDLVATIVKNATPAQLTPQYLEILSNYILDAASKDKAAKRDILTDNRMVTINKRETSYEGLLASFENGEDGLYNLFVNDKNVLLEPKIEITDADIEEIPGLKELRAEIEKVEAQAKRATGKRKYYLIKAVIEMRKDQYVLKNFYKQPVHRGPNASRGSSRIELDENITFDKNNEPVSDGLVSLFNPEHVSALLCNLESLQVGLSRKISSDFYYLVKDFEKLMERTLKNYPLYADLVKYKVNGKQNIEIQKLLEESYGIKHSVEYISSLWRNKIPKMIAEKAKEEYIVWYYTYVERGEWKKCNRCGQIKLAHNRFFSKNNTSKDGWYSICKECRNAKTKEKK
jgi:hypothetical protein